MSDGITTALIALGGVFLSAFVSYLVSVKTTRYNYKQLFAETVSQSRNKWLNEMREYVSDMLANKRREIYGNCNDNNCVEVCNKYDSCKFQVIMRLNKSESDHRQLRALIEALDGFTATKGSLKEYELTEQAILEISTRIFKDEWEKVKIEAKGDNDIL